MDKTNLNAYLDNLKSDDPEITITALEEAVGMVQDIIGQTMVALQENPNRFLIAEQLYRFGPSVVAPLREVLVRTEDAETKSLAALALLQFNVEDGIPWLLDALSSTDGLLCVIAYRLAERHITVASHKIIERLRSYELSNVDHIVCLVAALQELGVELPSDLRERLSGENVPWQVRTLVEG